MKNSANNPPSDDRIVILIEEPCKENHHKKLAAAAQYVRSDSSETGQWRGVATGNIIRVTENSSYWLEWPEA